MPKAYWWHKRTNCCLVKSLPKLGASCTGSSQSSGLDRVGADHQQVAVCHLFRMMETTSTLSTQLPEVSKDIVSMSWSSKPCRLIVGIMPWGFSCSPVGVFTTSLQSPRSTNHSPKSSCVVKSGLQRYVPLWEDETSLSAGEEQDHYGFDVEHARAMLCWMSKLRQEQGSDALAHGPRPRQRQWPNSEDGGG